jgi:hypothetical protein
MDLEVKLNDHTGEYEVIVDATIKSVSKIPLKNSNDIEYFVAQIVAHFPDGDQKGSTCIWATIQDMNEFDAGDEIQLAVQLEGKYAGYSKIHLAGAQRFDVAKYAVGIPTKATAPAEDKPARTPRRTARA